MSNPSSNFKLRPIYPELPSSIEDVVAPLEERARTSQRLFSIPLGEDIPATSDFLARHSSEREWRAQPKNFPRRIPRYLFMGPQGGAENARIGLFAGIHGDEPAGTFALLRLIEELEKAPNLAHGYELFIYPICNPGGFEAGTRFSDTGLDLNREFWRNSAQPEVRALESEIAALRFDGMISLHSDDTSDGLYGFVAGPTLTHELLGPALKAASRALPINQQSIIDSFQAEQGIIASGYQGVLSAPPDQKPRPFEIVFETPQLAAMEKQVDAMVISLLSILDSFRRLRAFAFNI